MVFTDAGQRVLNDQAAKLIEATRFATLMQYDLMSMRHEPMPGFERLPVYHIVRNGASYTHVVIPAEFCRKPGDENGQWSRRIDRVEYADGQGEMLWSVDVEQYVVPGDELCHTFTLS